MKIVFPHPYHLGSKETISNVILRTSRELKDKHEIIYVGPSSINENGIRNVNVDVSYRNVPFLSPPKYVFHGNLVKKLDRLCGKEDVDVINVHWPTYTTGFFSGVAKISEKHDIPMVVTVHWPVDSPNLGMWRGPYWLYNELFTKKFFDKSDMLLAVSKGLKNNISERFGVSGSRIKVVYNGSDYKTFKKDKESGEKFRKKYSVKSKRIVLTVGRIVKYKGIQHGVEMLKKIDASLLVVGGGKYRDVLEAKFRRSGMSDRVHFTGYVPDKDLVGAYNLADVYVSFSAVESFGLAVLDAQACEKPVVGFDVLGVNEVVKHGKTGFLIDYGNCDKLADRTADLLDDKRKGARMGKNGRRRVLKKFTWKKVAQRVENAFESLA